MQLKFAKIFVLIISLPCNGQNLIPNPSFESYNTLECFWIMGQTDFSNVINDWSIPTLGTSDILSTLLSPSCELSTNSTANWALGNQSPRTGDNMAGIYTYVDYSIGNPTTADGYREYLQIQLTNPLVVNEYYYVEFWASKADARYFATNNLGAYFSDTLVNVPIINGGTNLGVLSFTPQINETEVIYDSIGWVKVSGCFKATSPAEYMLIGNFYSDQNSLHPIVTPFDPNIPGMDTFKAAYYFIDDVSVTAHSTNFSAGSDVSICDGDTVELSAVGGTNYLWDNGSQTESIIVSPGTTTTYTVSDSSTTCILSDDIVVTVFPLPNPIITLNQSELITGVFNSYQWYLDGVLIPNATDQSYNFTEIGLYTVEVSNQNGCSNYSNSFLVEFIGLNELDASHSIELVRIIDLMGRETTFKPNTPLIFIFNDGSRKRVMTNDYN